LERGAIPFRPNRGWLDELVDLDSNLRPKCGWIWLRERCLQWQGERPEAWLSFFAFLFQSLFNPLKQQYKSNLN
jgi:hypothetical protein